MITFATPLILLLLIPALLWMWRSHRNPPRGAIRYSTLRFIKAAAQGDRFGALHLLSLLRAIALCLLIIGLARPQSGQKTIELLSEGIDIVIALDTSGSMKAVDVTQGKESNLNRLMVARTVAQDFIAERKADRIGLVVFGEEAFTQCPLTLDYGILQSFLQQSEIGMAGEGTALGSAIGVSTNRLKDTTGASRVLILVTDGRNTAGRIPPLEAARAAAAFGVKIYTIGIGSNRAYVPVDTLLGRQLVPQQLDLDETTLKEIAQETGGQYFRATDKAALEKTYAIINELEQTEIEVKEHMDYTELYGFFVFPGLLLLLLEVILANTKLRKLP